MPLLFLAAFFSSFLVSKSYCVDEYIVCFQQFSHSTKTLVDCCLEAAWIGGWGHYFTLENTLYLTVLGCLWQGRATKNKTILQVIFIPVNFQMWWFNKILESGVNLASWRRMKVALEWVWFSAVSWSCQSDNQGKSSLIFKSKNISYKTIRYEQ